MTQETALPLDALAGQAAADIQRQAANMAQDAFGRLFRLSLDGDIAQLDEAVGEIARRASAWSKEADSDTARALRLAMLVSGMDQWGLAYTQAFQLTAITGLSATLGRLRNGLDAREEAQFSQQFAALEAGETHAIDFKMELRRNIHLALWHALTASADADEGDQADAAHIASTLGSLLLALHQRMPTLGWRLVADTLAHIQIRCLTTTLGERGQDQTQGLFGALRQALPSEQGSAIFNLANQAAVSWQQAARQPVQ